MPPREETTQTPDESTESALEAAEQGAEAEAQAEQQAAEQEEASKIDAFLRSRGVPGRGGAYEAPAADDEGEEVTDPRQLAEEGEEPPESAETDEETPEAAPEPTEEELMGRELEVLTNALDQVEGKSEKGDEGEEQLSDAEKGFRRREESRRVQRVQGENEQLRDYVNTLLSHLRQSEQRTQEPRQEGTGETEAPDLFEDPDGYVEAKLQERLKPYEERFQKLDALEQRQRANEVKNIVRQAENAWEAEHPGYVDRLAAGRRAFVAEWQARGLSLEGAQQMLMDNQVGLLKLAAHHGLNPAEVMDREASRWLSMVSGNGNGAPAPAQNPQQQPQGQTQQAAGKKPGKFDRAREAASSAAAGTLSEGSGGADGGEITADTLLASGATPDQIHTVLSRPDGRQNFFQIMNQLERAADTPDE